MPSSSVMWGPWATGMAVTDPRIFARFERAGLRLIQPAAGLRMLGHIVASLPTPNTVAAPIAWRTLLPAGRPVPPLLQQFAAPAAGILPATPAVRLNTSHIFIASAPLDIQ